MRRSIAAVGLFVAALCSTAARAGDLVPAAPSSLPPVRPGPAPAGEPAVVVADAPPCTDLNAWLAMQLMLGQQTGIRGQFTPLPEMKNPLVVEAFYGAMLTRITSSEAAGAGGRWMFYRDSRDGNNALALGPGADALFALSRGHAVVVAPSLDISWLHGFGGRGGLELGLEAGVGIGASGSRRSGDNAAGQVSPLISGFFGLRF